MDCNYPKKVEIIEVATRDGWQSYKYFIPTATKIDLIKKVIDNGAPRMDLISFANPKYVPQFADAEEVIPAVLDYAAEHGTKLLLNAGQQRRWDNAMEQGWFRPDVVYITTGIPASERHSMENFHRTIDEGLEMMARRAEDAHKRGIEVFGAIICAFGGPYGEVIPTDQVVRLAEKVLANGVSKLGLADTAGTSVPSHTREVIRAIKEICPADKLNVHLHDAHGFGLANAYVALEEGVASFDTALGGMGGCPFIKDAKGNIATEDFINMCDQMGVETGMSLKNSVDLARNMGDRIGFSPVSYMSLSCSCNE